MADKETCQNNGVYVTDENDEFVRKIYFKPDCQTLKKYNKNEEQFKLVNVLIRLLDISFIDSVYLTENFIFFV